MFLLEILERFPNVSVQDLLDVECNLSNVNAAHPGVFLVNVNAAHPGVFLVNVNAAHPGVFLPFRLIQIFRSGPAGRWMQHSASGGFRLLRPPDICQRLPAACRSSPASCPRCLHPLVPPPEFPTTYVAPAHQIFLFRSITTTSQWNFRFSSRLQLHANDNLLAFMTHIELPSLLPPSTKPPKCGMVGGRFNLKDLQDAH
jgi:hypothetical protein